MELYTLAASVVLIQETAKQRALGKTMGAF